MMEDKDREMTTAAEGSVEENEKENVATREEEKNSPSETSDNENTEDSDEDAAERDEHELKGLFETGTGLYAIPAVYS